MPRRVGIFAQLAGDPSIKMISELYFVRGQSILHHRQVRGAEALLVAVDVNKQRAFLFLSQPDVYLKSNFRQQRVTSFIPNGEIESMITVNAADVDLAGLHVGNRKLKFH